MRQYWILPNREQGDDVLLHDGARILKLRQILDPVSRPEGFSHGVPTEIFERCPRADWSRVLFAQRFVGWNGDHQILSIVTPAGQDITGRLVHIGLLLILERGEQPRFDAPCAGLSEEDAMHARALLERLTSAAPKDLWARSVHDLCRLPPEVGPATNVALDRALVPFHSLYVLDRHGLRRRGEHPAWTPGVARILFLLLFVMAGVWASVKVGSCVAASRHNAGAPSIVGLEG